MQTIVGCRRGQAMVWRRGHYRLGDADVSISPDICHRSCLVDSDPSGAEKRKGLYEFFGEQRSVGGWLDHDHLRRRFP